MDAQEFKNFRSNLHKTQEEMSRLMGLSVKAIRSYEQGWRTIPAHAERQLLFLMAKKAEITTPPTPCWIINHCPDAQKNLCPAWEFRAGTLCWFINGTICSGIVHKDWKEKIEICKKCPAFPAILKSLLKPSAAGTAITPHQNHIISIK